MKQIHNTNLIQGKIYRNPINTVKLLYIGLLNGHRWFKIIKYFNDDYYPGFIVGENISDVDAFYATYNYFDTDNYIKFGR